jgi:hypothetical protein
MSFMHLMRPLTRLRRAAEAAPPTLEAQLAALDSGSPELIAAALDNDDETLRAAAVRKLPDGETLRRMAGLRDAPPGVPVALERLAQERMAELIDAGTVDMDGLRTAAMNLDALLSVAGLCTDPARLPAMLAAIDDPQRLARLVLEGSTSRLRQLAAQRIEDPGELGQLLKQVRGKDKSVYKIIKQKCDALRAEEQRLAQQESDVNALCAALERHSHRYYDALYVPSFEQFEARWRTLESLAAPPIRDRTRQSIDRCRQVIDGHLRQLALKAAQASQESALRAARQEADAQAEAEARRRVEEAALAATEAAKVREAEEQERAAKRAAEALALRQIGGLIGKADGALRDGNTGRAAGLRRALEEKLPALPVVPASLARQVQQLDAQLTTLKEWKDYAVAPKRAGLIEAMEALIGSTETPTVLAEQIKRLQEEWKTISKGIVSDSAADWQRFHQASQTAYQPCRDYFEAQSRLRHENLEQRRSVLARLRAFESAHSGEHPDWRAVAAVLREAPREFRRHSPVERTAGSALQQEFDTALERLQGRLDAWHELNAAAKKSLIERAQRLLEQADSREATDAVKRLQLQWKDVGAARRDQEQRLWSEFREHCDAVFQRRQQAHAEHAAGLEANKGRALALCEEAERAAGLSGPAVLAAAAQIPLWRAAFESVGEIPRIDERALRDRFERALKHCQSMIAQHRAQEHEQAFTDILEAARRIQAYGWAVAQQVAAAECEALKQSAETFIAGIGQLPKAAAPALKEAWEQAHAASGRDTVAHEIALRTLCVRSEILTDRPTPPEDQALRRNHQVQRLMRMGQHSEATPDTLDGLVWEWVCVGPVAPATHESLLARFRSCR